MVGTGIRGPVSGRCNITSQFDTGHALTLSALSGERAEARCGTYQPADRCTGFVMANKKCAFSLDENCRRRPQIRRRTRRERESCVQQRLGSELDQVEEKGAEKL